MTKLQYIYIIYSDFISLTVTHVYTFSLFHILKTEMHEPFECNLTHTFHHTFFISLHYGCRSCRLIALFTLHHLCFVPRRHTSHIFLCFPGPPPLPGAGGWSWLVCSFWHLTLPFSAGFGWSPITFSSNRLALSASLLGHRQRWLGLVSRWLTTFTVFLVLLCLGCTLTQMGEGGGLLNYSGKLKLNTTSHYVPWNIQLMSNYSITLVS